MLDGFSKLPSQLQEAALNLGSKTDSEKKDHEEKDSPINIINMKIPSPLELVEKLML